MTILYVLLALILGGGLGYAIAYTRYGDKQMIDELREKYRQLQEQYESTSVEHTDLYEQNRILKQQAQMLLHQNEDFSKMVSELSRYYYRIKQGSLKLKELVDIMGVYDDAMEQKLDHLVQNDEEVFHIPTGEGYTDDKKYF